MKAIFSWLRLVAGRTALALAMAGSAMAAAPSARPGMGAVPYADADGTGTTFRVWAGAAKKVEVSGEFNGWGRVALASEGSGIWSADVPGAGHGQAYKFILDGDNWRKDPRAVRVESSATGANCYIYDHSLFNWEGAERVVGGTDGSACIYRNDLVVYEMHVGSFNGENYLPATFDSAVDKIPHLKKLGVSAVEVMPIAEFAGDRSWGYNPGDLFAPESGFGGADGFKRFVKACHQAGIAVIVDVVHNHYGPTDLAIWQFDGNGPNGGMYFYDDDRRYTDWGETRPDYGDTNVTAFIRDQIFSLVEDYHVDGFRWDSVFNIAYVGGSWNQEGADLLTAINNELYEKHPDVFRIAEDNALTTWEESWMGFEAQWHPGFLTDIRALATASDDAWRSMPTLAGRLCLYGGFYQVLYAESHDSCGDLNNKHRLPREIDGGSPQGYWAKKRAFLANAVALVSPGIPMIFMGTEYNEDWDFSNDHSLRWSGLAEENAGIVRMYADLIALRRNAKGVTDALRDAYNAQCTVCNDDGKVVAVARGDGLLLVFNWSANAYQPYETVGFPASGTWHCLYNSDSSAYDASFGNVGPAVGDTVSVGDSHIAAVPLGAYSLQIWGASPLPVDATAAFDPPVPDGCTNVTIAFDPGDGALASADAVSARIGLDTWDNASIRTVPMSRAGGGTVWTCTFDIPDDTSELLVCFHDATATVWENNHDENWHCAIANCGGMPSAVTADPARPTDGSTFTLRYEVNAGPLTNRPAGAGITARVGFNGWSTFRDIPMENAAGDLWTCGVEIPLGTWYIPVCFYSGKGDPPIWDNNNERNWTIAVAIEDTTPVPAFAITTPSVSPATVTGAAVAVRGTATNFVAPLLWTNTANGSTDSLLPGAAWTADIPLAYGTNLLHFIALNPNDGAADSDYTDFRTGANGGHGFAPWEIDIPSANAGVFADAADGWGFWANSGAMVEARRPFIYPLQPGDTVTFGFRNGYIDDGGSLGFGFRNAHGQTALEWYFNGGSDGYTLNAAARTTNALPFTDALQRIAFTLGPDWTFTLAVGTNTWTGNLKNASVERIACVRFWNYTAGGGSDHNFYITDLAVNGSNPYLSPELSQTLTVIRPGAPAPVVITPTSATVSTDPDTGLPLLTATLSADAPAILADSVWYAVTLDPATHSWNWTNIPSSSVTLSGPTVTIRCPDLPTAIYSLGTPGGSP
jgi:1,4-alpha-glucan branching enzyme